jgi:hypothetical protein
MPLGMLAVIARKSRLLDSTIIKPCTNYPEGDYPFTLQLGDPNTVAERLAIT